MSMPADRCSRCGTEFRATDRVAQRAMWKVFARIAGSTSRRAPRGRRRQELQPFSFADRPENRPYRPPILSCRGTTSLGSSPSGKSCSDA